MVRSRLRWVVMVGLLVGSLAMLISPAVTQAQARPTFAKAVEYFWSDDREAGMEAFTLLIEDNPDMAEAYAYRAVIHALNGDFADADTDITTALELEADNVLVVAMQARVLLAEGDYDQAMAVIEEALALDDQFSIAYYVQGRIYYALDDDAAAIDALELALLYDSGLPDLAEPYYRALNNGYIAYALESSGDWTRPLEYMSVAVELNPDDPYFNYAQGFYLNKLGEYELALPYLEIALEINPTDGSSYLERGFAISQSEGCAAAMADFESAIEFLTNPETLGYAWGNLAYCHYELEAYADSMYAYSQAHFFVPNISWVNTNGNLILENFFVLTVEDLVGDGWYVDNVNSLALNSNNKLEFQTVGCERIETEAYFHIISVIKSDLVENLNLVHTVYFYPDAATAALDVPVFEEILDGCADLAPENLKTPLGDASLAYRYDGPQGTAYTIYFQAGNTLQIVSFYGQGEAGEGLDIELTRAIANLAYLKTLDAPGFSE